MSIANKIYRSFLNNTVLLLVSVLLAGCSLQKVKYTPPPGAYTMVEHIKYINGFPKQKQPWVVFSDRSNNRINPTEKEDASAMYKDASFLTPFIVLNENKGMYKVAEYKEALINDGKLPKSKGLKVLGWIPEERLLLWNNSLKNSKTGFVAKATIVINDSDVIRYSEKYIDHDSIMVFSDPDLISKAKKKVKIGSLVYVYKYSEDKSRALIGKEQGLIADSIQSNIYGWVSKNMLSSWGERSSLKLVKDSARVGIGVEDTLIHQFAVSPQELVNRNGIESVYPKIDHNRIKFFTNTFDYDKNKIYNVLGNPIYYKRYKKILSDNQKLNLIFVLDVSKNNKLYIPIVKSLLQELQLNFMHPDYFTSIKFGGVVYKQNSCGIRPLRSFLSTNYRDIALFFEQKIEQLTCSDTAIIQPVDKGLLSAAQMLYGAENETNIIILIGTTADESSQSQIAINALSRANAKTVFFQTQSKSADAYNDFVLLGEKAVVNSAKNIAERKKEKIVNQNDLLINNSYSLSKGENGIYFLDFPRQSMTQGFVLFPRKGETMPAGVLKSAIDTLLVQVTKDNKQIDSMLTKYFRSEIGVNHTSLAAPYHHLFPLTDQLIPTQVAASVLNHNTSFLIEGQFRGVQNSRLPSQIEQGILLNEQEYEQLRSFYTHVYKEVLSKDKFSKRKGLRTYLKVVSEHNPRLERIKRRKLKNMPVSELIKFTTGFSISGNSLMNMTPKEWIKNKKLSSASVLKYFEQYRDIAARLGISKGDALIRIDHEGQVFYWLNHDYIPIIKNN
ncbi:VWA domain-containing protein [Elizabethkingia argentiflava]|uniref:VWA domain-containing protein n=1 Tax=Elizabethkingia argenteiflava TaxID=2681556 RepID=A0A845PQU8_9FLAO|nr:type VI secretion system protein TssR domain-containing protein [Elizabethkingia argenteiflava]NAW50015.1 VWA domain-containing protein [Elizabethkingia argenteiflava]